MYYFHTLNTSSIFFRSIGTYNDFQVTEVGREGTGLLTARLDQKVITEDKSLQWTMYISCTTARPSSAPKVLDKALTLLLEGDPKFVYKGVIRHESWRPGLLVPTSVAIITIVTQRFLYYNNLDILCCSYEG